MTELNQLQERGQRLEQVLYQKGNHYEDLTQRVDIAKAEVQRCNTEISCLQKDCESANHRNAFCLET